MRLIILLVFGLWAAFSPMPARAQEDVALYRVADVIADVTAASAPVAREHAIMQAQRLAFATLLERLGAADPVAKANDEALAALVQAFEIQKEHASGLRYTGTFAVQFKPAAVKQWLDGVGVRYSEERAKPVVVLPLLKSGGKTVLWEDLTPWRASWMDGVKGAGLVPLVVPAGELDDIALISTPEAVSGKTEAMQALMQKYEAGGVLVAIFEEGNAATDTKGEAIIETRHYSEEGSPVEPKQTKISWATASQRQDATDSTIKSLVKQEETIWRKDNKVPTGEVTRLPVDVAVPTLAAFSQTQAKLSKVPSIASAQVISMTRGMVHIELAFRGDILAVQNELREHGLLLEQGLGNVWLLRQQVVE